MDIFKLLGINSLILFIPGILQQVGMSLKNKDDNNTGFDDAGGNVVIALGPVVPAFLTGNQTLIKKVLWGVYNTIGGYLGTPYVEPPVAFKSTSGLGTVIGSQ